MNEIHQFLDWLLPFDFSNPYVQDIALRALPFTVTSIFLQINVLTILLRMLHGPRDSQVISQLVVKQAIIVYLSLLAWNYWGNKPVDPMTFDITRGWMGVFSVIGIPIAARYLARAVRDTWMIWREWWDERHPPIDPDAGFP